MNEGHAHSSEPSARSSDIDVLSDVLGSVRLSGAMLFLVEAATPWMTWAPRAEVFRPAVLPASEHVISYHVVTQGTCWAGLRGAPPERYEAGDVLVVPHGDAYCLAEPADAKETYGIVEAVEFFRCMAAGDLPTTVAEGGDGREHARFICGFLGCRRRPFNPVLAALPRVIHLRAAMQADSRLRHLVDFAIAELRQRSRGGQGVLTRLAELMFIALLRSHLGSTAPPASGWLAGLNDPLVARALALLHAEPARHWTLDRLAAAAGASRSVLAERFAHFVGQPPMHYLAQWRMQLASRLLAESSANKVAAVAEAVGYASEAAFSRSFKKRVGVAPGAWRQREV